MSRRLESRIRALETAVPERPPDLAAEAAAYGALLWGDGKGARCYARTTAEGYELRVIHPGGPDLLHIFPGLDGSELGGAAPDMERT